MFEKLKQIKEIRDQAKVIQAALSGETITADKAGITVVMDGNMNVKEVKLSKEMTKEEIEKHMPEAFNDVIKKTQKVLAEKMRAMGGIPGLG